MNKSIPYSKALLNYPALFKKPLISGCNLPGSLKYLFKSSPDKDVLEFPIITPSGFSIGTIMKIVFLRIFLLSKLLKYYISP